MFIYKTTNTINNKIYIGYHTKDKSNYLGSGSAIEKAIKKYGRENFTREIIDTAETYEELCKKEIYWIAFYRKLKCSMYNIADGGKGGGYLHNHPNKKEICKKIGKNSIKLTGRKLTSEHKLNISKNQTGRIVSKETRKKLSIANIGNKNPMFGKIVSKETLDKMSKSMTGKKRSDEAKMNMSIGRKGMKFSNEHKLNISKNRKGKNTGKRKTLICPYCNKEGGHAQMKQWHFDNCKFKYYADESVANRRT